MSGKPSRCRFCPPLGKATSLLELTPSPSYCGSSVIPTMRTPKRPSLALTGPNKVSPLLPPNGPLLPALVLQPGSWGGKGYSGRRHPSLRHVCLEALVDDQLLADLDGTDVSYCSSISHTCSTSSSPTKSLGCPPWWPAATLQSLPLIHIWAQS